MNNTAMEVLFIVSSLPQLEHPPRLPMIIHLQPAKRSWQPWLKRLHLPLRSIQLVQQQLLVVHCSIERIAARLGGSADLSSRQ